MSGYVASGRIVGRTPRLARGGRAMNRDRAPARTAALEATVIDTTAGGADCMADAGRLMAFRERWSQLTFFLFDPNSWR